MDLPIAGHLRLPPETVNGLFPSRRAFRVLRDARVTMVGTSTTARGIMRIPFIHGLGTVGREDRLVRGCIALSLLLLVGFVVALSGEPGVVGWIFGVLALYFSGTAVVGRDPLYAHFGIDTRRDAETGRDAHDHQAWPAEPPTWVDLRDSRVDPGTSNSRDSARTS
jgi:hypothetical protein